MAEMSFNELAAHLDKAGPKGLKQVEKSMTRAGVDVKKDWQKRAKRRGLAAYAKSVDFDVTTGVAFGGATVEVAIGPNLDKPQGMFGLVEDAAGGVKSAPQHAGRDAVEAIVDDLDDWLAQALEDAGEG